MKWVPTTAADVAARWKEFRRVDIWDLLVQGIAGAIRATIGKWEVHLEPESPASRTRFQNFLFAGNGGHIDVV